MLPRKHGKTQHIEIVAKGIEEAIGKWNTLVCVRCGRQKTLANIKHTRLYGIMCVCGSQEWKAAEHGVEADALPCGHNQGVEFGESSWSCVVCGQPVRRSR